MPHFRRAWVKRRAESPIRQAREKGLCGFQVGRVEPLGEPVVDRLEKRYCMSGTALIAQQPGKARGGAQFPAQGTLPACPVERLPEMILGRCLGSEQVL